MEINVKVLLCLFDWLLNKGIPNIQTNNELVKGDEFLSVKLGRKFVDFRLDPDIIWGSIEEMHLIIHYCLMLCSGYLLIKEELGWVCFKPGNEKVEYKKKYDMPSVQQCSCLRVAYNSDGECRHIKMLKGYLLLQERTQREYKGIY